MFIRTQTKKTKAGNVQIGHQNKVVIQSMTNTKTGDFTKTLQQIKQLHHLGCELVRISILDIEDLKVIKKLVDNAPCPLIADIHYNYLFAIKCLEQGIQKIRINPDNIGTKEQLKEIIKYAKKYKATIRIGINEGSIKKKLTVKQIINNLKNHIKFFEQNKFYDIVVSLKSSDPYKTEQLYLLASKTINYPLHLGVTEAGPKEDAIIKSTIGLSNLIKKGIGDTIRISISGNPLNEPIICKKLLNNLGLNQQIVNIISCPTCGRLLFSFEKLLNLVNEFCNANPKKVNVAIMGCSVNGIEECKNADIGFYGLKNQCKLYFKGKDIGIYSENKIFNEFKKYYEKL